MMAQQIYKTIFVTGATSGFGKAITINAAQQGYKVIACGRRKDRLEELKTHSDNIVIFELDVTKHEEIEKLYQQLHAQSLLPNVIINNAGLALGLETADQANLCDWEQMIDVNIKGLITVSRIFLPELKKQNKGYVINIGSIAGNWPYPGANTYGATKAFVSQFSKNLRADLLGTNIKVTCLEPGLSLTEFSEVRFKGDSQKADDVYKGTTPLSSTNIADIVLWLLSMPEAVNVNSMEVMPTCQAWGPLAVCRQ